MSGYGLTILQVMGGRELNGQAQSIAVAIVGC
jgi:hypothetical protein